MQLQRRVVVTGLGILSPIGNSKDTSWSNCINGVNGITEVDFGIADCPVTVGGKLKDLDLENLIPSKLSRRIDPFVQYGIISANEAIKDSHLNESDINPEKIGVSMGSGIGGLQSIELNHNNLNDRGFKKVSPFFVPGSIVNMTSGLISIEHGFKGPNSSIVTACSSGSHCIGFAARSIAYGDADIMIAGGSEMASTPLGIAGFLASKALSKNSDPESASRPWDKDRDGFVLSDGAGAIVLEEYEIAKSRGANIYAELIGFGMSSDAYHMTAPPETGAGARLAMQNALNDSNIDQSEISYINAHGPSTPLGDIAESKAVVNVFQEHSYDLNINSTKSMTGHLLGAAGAIEAISCILAMKHNIVPPTINHFNIDDGIDANLNFTFSSPQKRNIKVSMSNTFGFGGHNACVIFKEVD